MYEHFNREIIVIIDEFDCPINSLYSPNEEYFENIIHVIKSMLISAFKEKSQAEFKKVILIGVLPLAKGNIFSGLNNFTKYGVNETRYTEDFGFTDEEVSSLIAKRLGSSGDALTYQQARVKEWYNGYLIGESIIYNPWSIMNFISNAQENFEDSLKPYWVESANPKIIEDMIMNLEVEKTIRGTDSEWVY